MTTEQILPIIDAWSTTYRDLAALPFVGNVQIFENKGAVMGCSNPHPHGQVWATEAVPEEPLKELRAMRKYHDENGGTCLLCDYAALELTKAAESLARGDGDAAHRAVCSNDHFLCVVPFWAVWPYETLVLPYRRHVPDLLDMTDGEKRALADIIRRIACRYDNVFDCSFPYSMGIHQRPVSAAADEQKDPRYSHFHIHFYPPLLRSATVRKFLVGFEMMGEPQRDVTAEQAAKILRDCSEVHYKKRRIPK
ncbi:MAG: galactose-1-phosphate uridyl transferase [Olpidium bornovanus]|uniref:Galactose-1-phosphate uridylyltransferase n=1 Tax=Olpidium bornovanus TaxID=278681 RepID=A0A8H7ZUB2_9FUNG|nr:MAG: galactose-1-phosphate uridyl transferase [Olpidium bornovanus]